VAQVPLAQPVVVAVRAQPGLVAPGRLVPDFSNAPEFEFPMQAAT